MDGFAVKADIAASAKRIAFDREFAALSRLTRRSAERRLSLQPTRSGDCSIREQTPPSSTSSDHRRRSVMVASIDGTDARRVEATADA